jgi:amino acid adenylation domain-containing protein
VSSTTQPPPKRGATPPRDDGMNKPAEILESLARHGVSIWAEGSRIRFRASKGTLTDEMKALLSANKASVLAAWRKRAATKIESYPAIHAQRALWFLYQDQPDNPAYNVVMALRIRSKVDIAALRYACQALLDRHPSLRTTFVMGDVQLEQHVHGDMALSFRVHELRGSDFEKLRDEAIRASQHPFRLETGPMLRVDVFHREDTDHLLLITAHHIVIDGWSYKLLIDDLLNNYCAETNEGPAPPARPEYDLLDFARWQEQMLASPEGQAHELYWTKALAGEIPKLDLPTEKTHSPGNSGGMSWPVELGADLSEAVRTLAVTAGTTPFVVLLAAYYVLLCRYTGQTQLIVGTPTYGRNRLEFENIIGYLINIIALKADLSGDPTFSELVGQVKSRVLEGIQHQDYPLALLVEKLHPARNSTHTPVFQSVFNLHKFRQLAGHEGLPSRSLEAPISTGGLVVEPIPIPQQESQVGLALELKENGGLYQGNLKFNNDFNAPITMAAMTQNYVRLLRGIVASPDARISRLELLSPEERKHLVYGLNATDTIYPADSTAVDLFTDQVVRRPDAVAVCFEGRRITYAELDSRSNQMARHLQSFGVGPESLVGLCVDRGLEMMVGILGILKAGGAYLPLDPGFPPERLRYMAEDAGIGVLVTQAALGETLFAQLPLVRVCVDQDNEKIQQHSGDPLASLAKPSNLAYVIYTSGSTGRPKGVAIEHRSLTNFLCSMAREPGLAETDVLLAVTTLSFDIAGLELFLPLVQGARVELVSRETAMDGVALGGALRDAGATVMQATPATWRMLVESGWQGDRHLKVLCGGEAMGRDLAARLVSACGPVWNMYGPTETTIWSSVARIDSEQVTIGRPIANTQMYVLDAHQQPVPIGVTGELWIGGEGVARGYLNRTELTDEKFKSDPFRADGRIYRTGDLARYVSSGQLECLGRSDDQVKVRGHRIELGEIESVLRENPQVAECAVSVRDMEGDRRLVAFVAGSGASADSCREFLRKRLPEYMVPAAFVFLDRLPLSPNGKVNRKALTLPEGTTLSSLRAYVAPRTATESIVVKVFEEVLGLERVGVDDDFFELGGHSLVATRVVSLLRNRLKVEAPIRWLFEAPTAARVSEYVETIRWAAAQGSASESAAHEERECREI